MKIFLTSFALCILYGNSKSSSLSIYERQKTDVEVNVTLHDKLQCHEVVDHQDRYCSKLIEAYDPFKSHGSCILQCVGYAKHCDQDGYNFYFHLYIPGLELIKMTRYNDAHGFQKFLSHIFSSRFKGTPKISYLKMLKPKEPVGLTVIFQTYVRVNVTGVVYLGQCASDKSVELQQLFCREVKQKFLDLFPEWTSSYRGCVYLNYDSLGMRTLVNINLNFDWMGLLASGQYRDNLVAMIKSVLQEKGQTASLERIALLDVRNGDYTVVKAKGEYVHGWDENLGKTWTTKYEHARREFENQLKYQLSADSAFRSTIYWFGQFQWKKVASGASASCYIFASQIRLNNLTFTSKQDVQRGFEDTWEAGKTLFKRPVVENIEFKVRTLGMVPETDEDDGLISQ